MSKNHFAVIMAGGIGSRFWPLSTSQHPKQFHDIMGQGKSLIRSTFERLQQVCPAENIYVVTNERYSGLVQEHLPEIAEEQVLKEPLARNTAPCLAYATQHILRKNPDGVMVVAPADHLIMNEENFSKIIKKSMKFAQQEDVLVTLGIKPTRPDTGYGYIQFHDGEKKNGFHKVKTFTEKPDEEMAKYFLECGEFLWNAGIFVWTANAIDKAIKQHLPDMHKAFAKGKEVYGTAKEKDFISKTYETCSMVSIDYGIMEKADNVYVYPSDFSWSDIGTWNAVYELLQKNKDGNVTKGDCVFLRQAKDNIVMAPNNKLIAINGVDNLIVVEHDGKLLVTTRDKEQEIRHLVNELKLKYGERFT